MTKQIKDNFVPFLFAAIAVGLLLFPIWSHVNQDRQIQGLRVNGSDDILVGASTLFAQNASVQLNLEVLGTYASVSGDLSFSGEIMPDGSTCSNGEILKKTGANDWDCAADDSASFDSTAVDATTWSDGANASNLWTFDLSGTDPTLLFRSGGFTFTGTASVSSDFEVGGYASASFFNATEDYRIGGTSVLNATTLGSGVITSSLTTIGTIGTGVWEGTAVTDSFVNDAITINGGTIGSNNISSGVTWTTLGTLTIGDGGDAVDFATSTWDVTAGVLTGMTLSTNNVTGTWTTTGNLTIGDGGDDVIIDSDTWNVSSLGAFTGVTGITSTGVIDFGGATSFEIPNSSGGPTLDTAGEIGGKTASTSAFFGHFDGTTAKAVHDPCFTYYYGTPDTAGLTDFGKYLTDPFTITEVRASASDAGSTGVTWNLSHGGNDVFTTDKLASAAFRYTTGFADATITDGLDLLLDIVSKSAVTLSLKLDICGYYPR